MEFNTKNIAYLVSSIGALAWGYFGITDKFPLENLVGLTDPTAGYIYAVIGLAGLASLAYTASVWDGIDPTVIAGLYVVADLGAVAWLYYWYADQVPTQADFLSFIPAEMEAIVYLVVGAGGLMSLLIALTFMDEDSNTTDASDALDG